MEEKLKRIELTPPDPQTLHDIRVSLDIYCTKTELELMAEAFRLAFGKCVFVCTNSRGLTTVCNEAMYIFSDTFRTDSLTKAIGWLLCVPENARLYIDTLSEPMKELWRYLLLNIYVTEEKAMEILGVSEPMFAGHRSPHYEDLSMAKAEYAFFFPYSGNKAVLGDKHYREPCTYISVTKAVYNSFFPLMFPQAYDTDLSLTVLPKESPIVVNFENESVAKYPLIDSMIKAGKLMVGLKTVPLADVKRAARQLGLLEFPASDVRGVDSIRSRTYIDVLAIVHSMAENRVKKKWTGLHEPLRYFLQNLEKLSWPLSSLLLPHIKGIRKEMVEICKLVDICKVIMDWLREEPERWVPVSDLSMKIRIPEKYKSITIHKCVVFNPGDQRFDATIVNELTRNAIGTDQYVQEFGRTAVKSFCFMLCSLGIVELELSEKDEANSPFDRAEYVRLTALGRYALGLTDEYDAPEPEHEAYFELDPDRLVIRSLVDPNPYAQLLLDTSVAISKNRFETSARSFLAHCTSRSDVDEKVSIFRRYVSNELPPLWEQFFASLLQHCNPLTKERSADYHIYSISPDNTGLIRLLTGTPSLRKLFVRAEGFLILVKKDDEQKLTDELKKFGYLL